MVFQCVKQCECLLRLIYQSADVSLLYQIELGRSYMPLNIGCQGISYLDFMQDLYNNKLTLVKSKTLVDYIKQS